MVTNTIATRQWLSPYGRCFPETRQIQCTTSLTWKPLYPNKPNVKLVPYFMPFLGTKCKYSKHHGVVQVISPNIETQPYLESLEALDDEYDGVIVDPHSLPSRANAFGSALKSSLLHWKSKGKKGIWLKIPEEQADLVPIAIREGFTYHHAEPGYVMLTNWIGDEPSMLPSSPSHQIGIAAFVINDKKEILVVKEKCPCSCSGVWKLPTGYINKSEDIFSGAMREVKEETGVETTFMEMVAFRHAHQLAFEKSDLQFVCMLKPLSSHIIIDHKEIQDAKWMNPEEVLGQAFYWEDEMSKRVIEICMATYENRYIGFVAHRLTSKFDGKPSYLYYKQMLPPMKNTFE